MSKSTVKTQSITTTKLKSGGSWIEYAAAVITVNA
jgi:hypothetical protein